RLLTVPARPPDPWLRLVPADVMRPRRVGRPGRGRTAFLRRRPTRIVDGRFDDGGYNATCMSSSAPAAAITHIGTTHRFRPRFSGFPDRACQRRPWLHITSTSGFPGPTMTGPEP